MSHLRVLSYDSRMKVEDEILLRRHLRTGKHQCLSRIWSSSRMGLGHTSDRGLDAVMARLGQPLAQATPLEVVGNFGQPRASIPGCKPEPALHPLRRDRLCSRHPSRILDKLTLM